MKDPEEKLVSAETMQKGIKNIIRVIEMHKNNQLDYLTVCGLVRKIFRAFDFDSDGILDKKESKALLDAFTQEMALTDGSRIEEFKDLHKRIFQTDEGRITFKSLLEGTCHFYGIQQPESKQRLDDIPVDLIRRSAHLSQKTAKNTDDDFVATLMLVRKLWQQYGADGTGLMDQNEARHFVNQFMSEYRGISVIPEPIFREWFQRIDTDGDNKTCLVQIAHELKNLQAQLPTTTKKVIRRDNTIENICKTIKERVTAVTVGDIMKGN